MEENGCRVEFIGGDFRLRDVEGKIVSRLFA
jgi:hypothetical protein